VSGTGRLALHAAFFLSGAAAIIYQLIWQRVLLGLYGSSIESVTVVVTAFMVGLGVGSLAGGWIADRTELPLCSSASDTPRRRPSSRLSRTAVASSA
jgi:predicted membrane-bound spermidine synthase